MTVVGAQTAAKLILQEGANIVGGYLSNGDLILLRKNGTTINAGHLRGAQGIQGPPGEVTEAELAAAIAAAHAPGAIDSAQLEDNIATTNKFADGAVTSTKIADDSVTSAELGVASVTTSKFGVSSVGEFTILNDSVTTAKIADTTVDEEALADSVGGTLASSTLYYYKQGGLVTLYTSSGGWPGTSSATLPAGYRPPHEIKYIPTVDDNATQMTNGHAPDVAIYMDGTIAVSGTPVGDLHFSIVFPAA